MTPKLPGLILQTLDSVEYKQHDMLENVMKLEIHVNMPHCSSMYNDRQLR